MYYVIFYEDWCSTIPGLWVNIKEETFKWPSKVINVTSAIQKGIAPNMDWKTKKYRRVMGPYG